MAKYPGFFPRELAQDENGAVAILVGVLITALVSMAALSVDVMNAYSTQARLQSAAEAAASAGVRALPDKTEARRLAAMFGGKNKPGRATGAIVTDADIVFGHWDKATGAFVANPVTQPVNAIAVVASLTTAKGNPLATYFGGVLGKPTIDIGARAIAFIESGRACVVALNGSEKEALLLKSNSGINTPNCEVHVASTSPSGLTLDSNAQVMSKRVCVKGGYKQKSNSTIAPVPETQCDEAGSDPFAGVAAPTVGACDATSKVLDNKEVTLTPGVYCGGLTIKNNSKVTFSPGTYVIKDGKFLVDSNTELSGAGVTFYLTGSAALLEFNSNTKVALSAPTTGPLAGILVFQDRAFGGQHKFDSNVAAQLEGAFYFKKGTFTSNSNARMASGSSCFMLVADKIAFDSNAGVDMGTASSSCPGFPGTGSGLSRIVR